MGRKKIYWMDKPSLQIPQNEDGFFTDIDGRAISFFGDTDLLPKNVRLGYTKEMMQEIVRCREDVIYFAENYFKAMTPRGFTHLELFDYQKDILKSWETNYKNVLMLPRQMGKSLLASIFITYTIIFGKDLSVGVAANKQLMSIEILDKVKQAYRYLPPWLQPGVEIWNAGSIKLSNGCRIRSSATSESSFRGMTFASESLLERQGKNIILSSILYVDEIAFIDKGKWEGFKKSVLPTTSSGKHSRIIYTSTPHGMNHFHKIWQDARIGVSGFKHKYFPYTVHPDRRDPKWKEEKIAELGGDLVAWSQEYACVVGDTNLTVEIDGIEKEIKMEELFKYM